ncbi:MAG: hypothetical protein ACPG8W_01840 [Candidatus Promineifilaceae bacterium]
MSEEKSKEEISSSRNRLGGRAPLYIAVGAAILGLLLVCVFAYILFCPENSCVPETGSPIPTPITPQVQFAEVDPPSIVVDIAGTDLVTSTIDVPTVLSLGGQDFSVQSSALAGGVWQPVVSSSTTSTWLNNTVINYVFAIQDTSANRAMITSLERGDEIVVKTKAGEQRIFSFNSRNLVPASQGDVFAQNSPSITLVLVGDATNNDRVVVRGNYQVEQAVQNIGPNGGDIESDIAKLGDVVQLGDIQIAAALFDNRPIEGSPFAYYLVDYQIQNVGNAPLDTAQVKMTLVDSLGVTYPMNLEANKVGNHPPLSPQLAGGDSAQATAGYQIPAAIDSNSLGWVVERIDTGEMVEIRVVAPEGEEGTTFTLQITANSPQLSPDAAQLFLTGSVTNIGNETAIINASDVSFNSEGADFLILSTKPAFPWVIQPGQAMEYELAVQRPINSDASIFTILDQSFQVTNYQ